MIQLDGLFRRNSKAREVAEILLSGEAASRAELSQRVKVSPTTVPRVVGALEDAGVRITRTLRDDQSTEYQVVGGVGGEIVGIDDTEPGTMAVYTAMGRMLDVEVHDIQLIEGGIRVRFSVDVLGERTGVVSAEERSGAVDVRVLTGNPQLVAWGFTDAPGVVAWVGSPERHLKLRVEDSAIVADKRSRAHVRS